MLKNAKDVWGGMIAGRAGSRCGVCVLSCFVVFVCGFGRACMCAHVRPCLRLRANVHAPAPHSQSARRRYVGPTLFVGGVGRGGGGGGDVVGCCGGGGRSGRGRARVLPALL